MKTLFVGGPEDGKRNDCNWASWGQTVQVPVFRPMYSMLDVAAAATDPSFILLQTDTYQLKKFRGESGEEHKVAFHSSIANPMEALIKGYHYHRRPRYGRSRRIPKIS